MPDEAKTRILSQLEAEEVPAEVVARLESPDGKLTMAAARNPPGQRDPELFHPPPHGGEPASGADGRRRALGPRRRCAPSSSRNVVATTSTSRSAGRRGGGGCGPAPSFRSSPPVLMGVEGVHDTSARATEGLGPPDAGIRAGLGHDPGGGGRAGRTRRRDHAAGGGRRSPHPVGQLVRQRDGRGWIRGPVGVDQLARFADEFVLRLSKPA